MIEGMLGIVDRSDVERKLKKKNTQRENRETERKIQKERERNRE